MHCLLDNPSLGENLEKKTPREHGEKENKLIEEKQTEERNRRNLRKCCFFIKI
jgi:hypothetical protein